MPRTLAPPNCGISAVDPESPPPPTAAAQTAVVADWRKLPTWQLLKHRRTILRALPNLSPRYQAHAHEALERLDAHLRPILGREPTMDEWEEAAHA